MSTKHKLKLFKDQKPYNRDMGDIILVQNELVTDLEQLAEELAKNIGVQLTESANGMNRFSRIYEKKRASPENLDQSVWYQLLCVPDAEPLEVAEDRAQQLITERLKAGQVEESMIVRYRSAFVNVGRDNQGHYKFVQNSAFIERAGESVPYALDSIKKVKEAVKKILDV